MQDRVGRVLNITPDSKYYVGNQPEKMPMDNSCNEDQNLAVDCHVILSQVLSNDTDDPLTFSLVTPQLGASTYIHITHPDTGVSPTSDHIIEDCERVQMSCRPIIEHRGVFVPDLADPRGHRKTKKGNTWRNQHGGEREKMDMRDFIKVDDNGRLILGKAVGSLGDFHDDLKSLFDTENIMKASAEFFEQKISSKVEQEV